MPIPEILNKFVFVRQEIHIQILIQLTHSKFVVFSKCFFYIFCGSTIYKFNKVFWRICFVTLLLFIIPIKELLYIFGIWVFGFSIGFVPVGYIFPPIVSITSKIPFATI